MNYATIVWKSFRKGFQEFGHSLMILINTLLLLFVYIVGVGLTAVVAKLFRKHFIKKKLGEKTYWEDLRLSKQKKDTYYRQF